ncbi:MAG: MATE family efflux transporter, partial [Erysipelotrichaceae bacterium]|nr:MATE family efflux transporter [Erysipelotrichaceae bacterium]
MLKTVINVAWPAVLESFFVALAGIIDTLMVSALGTSAVASIGLTTQPKFLALAVFMACNIALSALIARRVGQKDQKSANEILVTALVYVVIAAVVIT